MAANRRSSESPPVSRFDGQRLVGRGWFGSHQRPPRHRRIMEAFLFFFFNFHHTPSSSSSSTSSSPHRRFIVFESIFFFESFSSLWWFRERLLFSFPPFFFVEWIFSSFSFSSSFFLFLSSSFDTGSRPFVFFCYSRKEERRCDEWIDVASVFSLLSSYFFPSCIRLATATRAPERLAVICVRLFVCWFVCFFLLGNGKEKWMARRLAHGSDNDPRRPCPRGFNESADR